MDSNEDIIDRIYLTDNDEMVEIRECVIQCKLNKNKNVVERLPKLINQFIEEYCEGLSDDSNSSYIVVRSEGFDDDHATWTKSKFVSFDENAFFLFGHEVLRSRKIKRCCHKIWITGKKVH